MESQESQLGDIANESFCYLTTIGRNTGRAHTIEIWFAVYGDRVYMLSGGRERADWVRNILQTPEVTVRISNREFPGRGRIVTDPDEDRLARGLVTDKYEPSYGGDLSAWRHSAPPVAVDLAPPHTSRTGCTLATGGPGGVHEGNPTPRGSEAHREGRADCGGSGR